MILGFRLEPFYIRGQKGAWNKHFLYVFYYNLRKSELVPLKLYYKVLYHKKKSEPSKNKGPEISLFFLLQNNNFSKKEWITLKLYHRLQYPRRKVGIDFGGFNWYYLGTRGQKLTTSILVRYSASNIYCNLNINSKQY